MTQEYTWDENITREQDPYGPMEQVNTEHKADWVGKAVAETDLTNQADDIHELLGLDEDRWMIVGLYLSPPAGARMHDGSRHSDTVLVYAVDLVSHPDWKAGDDVPAVFFQVHDVPVQKIIQCFRSFSISLTPRAIAPERVKVEGLADIPVQED